MPIPKPEKHEEKNKFIGRCVSFLVDEGRPQKQALAICFSQWEKRNEDGSIVERLNRIIDAPRPILEVQEFVRVLDKDYRVFTDALDLLQYIKPLFEDVKSVFGLGSITWDTFSKQVEEFYEYRKR